MKLLIFLLFSFSASVAQEEVLNNISKKYKIEQNKISQTSIDSLLNIYPKNDTLQVYTLILDTTLSHSNLNLDLKKIIKKSYSEYAYNELISNYLHNHQNDSAQKWNKKLLVDIPNSQKGLIVKAWKYYDIKQYPRAIAIINSVEKLYGESAKSGAIKGHSYLRLKNISKASLIFESVLEKDSMNRNSILGLIEIYEQVKAYHRVISLSEKLIKKDSDNIRLLTTSANAYIQTGELQKSIVNLKKALLLSPNDIYTLQGLVSSYHAFENMDSLCKYQNQLLDQTILNKGEKEIIENLQIQNKSYCDNTKAEYYYQRGIAAFNLEQYENAIDYYNTGIKKFPDNFYCFNFKGNALMALKKYNQAIKAYDQSINIFENNNFKIKNFPKHMRGQELEFLGTSYFFAAESYANLSNEKQVYSYINKYELQFGKAQKQLLLVKQNALGIINLYKNEYKTAFVYFFKRYETSKAGEEDYKIGLELISKIYALNTGTSQKIYSVFMTTGVITKKGNYTITKKVIPEVSIDKAYAICDELIIKYPNRIEAYIILAFLNKEFNKPYCEDIRTVEQMGHSILENPYWEHCK
jgi:tetratricopeptide (TPR) repeat protein